MKFFLLSVGLLLAVFLLLLIAGGWWRTLLSLTLIWSITPYEQVIPDAPEILVVGDSTAYGTGATAAGDSIAGRIGQAYPHLTVRSRAVNGIQTAGLQERLDEWLGNQHYKLVVLQIGANDIIGNVPLAVSEENMRSIISRVQNQSDAVIWMHNGNVGAASAYRGDRAAELTERSREFRSMAQELVLDVDIHYVDLFTEAEEDVFVQNPERYLARDGLHPSSDGYGVWFAELQPVLMQILDKKDE